MYNNLATAPFNLARSAPMDREVEVNAKTCSLRNSSDCRVVSCTARFKVLRLASRDEIAADKAVKSVGGGGGGANNKGVGWGPKTRERGYVRRHTQKIF